MQARVIGVICCLSILFSTGRTQDFSDVQLSEESGPSVSKIAEVLQDDLNSKESDNRKVDSTITPTVTELLEQAAKRNTESQNVLQDAVPFSNSLDSGYAQLQVRNLADTQTLSPEQASFKDTKLNVDKVPLQQVKKYLYDMPSSYQNNGVNTETVRNAGGNLINTQTHPSLLPSLTSNIAPTSKRQALQARNDANLLSETQNKLSPTLLYAQNTDLGNVNRDVRRDIDESSNLDPYSPVSSKSSSSSNNVNGRSGDPSEFDNIPLLSPITSSGQAYASANAMDEQELNPYSFGFPSGFTSNMGHSILTNAMAETSSSGSTAIANSKIIRPYEYIYPHQTPGVENAIRCTRESELHRLWSRTLDCMICVCLNENSFLRPVCVSCAGCQSPPRPQPYNPEPFAPNPDPYQPIPDINVDPIKPPVPINGLTTPLPPPGATCRPLPSGRPFTNPLNPCQLCVCHENFNIFGKIDVTIDCQDNPNCVLPPEVNVLPPMPDQPVPIALPLCEKFPQNVIFPHPTDVCKRCKCSVEMSVIGVPEQQITCFVQPGCVPIPPPSPVSPYPEPHVKPFNPVTENPINPVPWPVISTTMLPPPMPKPINGPLPGPSPHESCRPFPPNQPFEHPWDPCQICQCYESATIGLVNVEIICYTKASCCIVSPEDVISAIAGNLNTITSRLIELEMLEKIMHMQDANAAISAGEHLMPIKSKNILIPSNLNNNAGFDGYLTYQPLGPYQGGNAISIAEGDQTMAESSAQSHGLYSGSSQSHALSEINRPSVSQKYPSYVSGSQQSADAFSNVMNNGDQASAEASAGVNNSPASIYRPGISQSLAFSEANAGQISGSQQSAESIATVNNVYGGGDYLPILPAYMTVPPYSQFNSEAQAGANVQYNKVVPTYMPSGIYNQYNPESSQSQPHAEANAQNSQVNAPISPYSQLNSEAQASANVQYNKLVPNYTPSGIYNQYNPEGSQSQAHAEANAQNSQVNALIPPYSQFNSEAQAGANVQYNKLVPTYTPSVIYNQYNPESSQSQAHAEANAQNSQLNAPIPPYSQLNSEAQAGANVQYNKLLPTYTPSGIYSQYNPESSQSEAHAEVNAQNSQVNAQANANANYNNFKTNTYKPPSLFNNPGFNQPQSNPSASNHYLDLLTSNSNKLNSIYPGHLYMNENQLFKPYNQMLTQNQAYSDASAQSQVNLFNPTQSEGHASSNALAQNFLINSGHYPGSYQSAKALSNIKSGEQSSAIAEATAQSHGYSSNSKNRAHHGRNEILSPGNPYQLNTGYISPQSIYPDDRDQILDRYKGVASNNAYLPQYPNGINYETNSLYHSGLHADANAQAHAAMKFQGKSGDVSEDDTSDYI